MGGKRVRLRHSVAKMIIYLKAWPSAKFSNKSNTGKWNSAVLLVEIRIRATLIHFPFPLLPQGSCRYSQARLDLPKEPSAFAVRKLACWKLGFGTCWDNLLKDELFQRLSILERVITFSVTCSGFVSKHFSPVTVTDKSQTGVSCLL